MTCGILLPRQVTHASMVSLLPFAGRPPPLHLSLRTAPIIARRVLIITAGHQPALTNAERKTKRAESQRLGKAVVLVQLGMKGMTPSFVEGLASALAANEFVKVI